MLDLFRLNSEASVSWGQIILALTAIVGSMAAGLIWTVKKLLGPNRSADALVRELGEQNKQQVSQAKALLEMMEKHHLDRETRAREQHADQLLRHEQVLEAIGDNHREVLGEFKRVMEDAGKRRMHDHDISAMLFRLQSIVTFQKAKEWNCQEAFLALLEYAVSGDVEKAKREFSQAHGPNAG